MNDGTKGPRYIWAFFAVVGLIALAIFGAVHASLNRSVFNANAEQIERTAPGPKLTTPGATSTMQGRTSVPPNPTSEQPREPDEHTHP